MLKALVITPNERTRDVGTLLAIARAEAQKREHTHQNIDVRRLLYDPVCDVYIALYEAGCSREADVSLRRKKMKNE